MDALRESFLRRLPVLAGLDAPAMAFLAGTMQQEHFAAGTVILHEGEAGNRMFLLQSGRVRVVKAAGQPHEAVLTELGPGEFFGEMSLVESVARSASVVAVEDTAAFTLRGVDFYHLYKQRPDQYGIVMLNIARDLARRLRALDERFAALSH
jgi:CRP/FNR family cyclic AMP-dependent transcriptional regulator